MVQLAHTHPWNLTPREAVALQREWAGKVRIGRRAPDPKTIAGVDVSVRGGNVQTALVVLELASLEPIEQVVWRGSVTFPYVSGLLSFREIPAILPALEKLQIEPDVFMLDGQGYAHPRRFGLACHLGVILEKPTFGVAKSRLTGLYREPGIEKGDRAPLDDRGERIGTILRTRSNVKPVFVSAGHMTTLKQAEELAMQSTTKYRIPEPTRLAHHLSRREDV